MKLNYYCNKNGLTTCVEMKNACFADSQHLDHICRVHAQTYIKIPEFLLFHIIHVI
jgi:hypothetical protein